MAMMAIVAHIAEECPVLPRLVLGKLGISLDAQDTPVSHTQEVPDCPHSTKYHEIPRIVLGSPASRGLPWIPRHLVSWDTQDMRVFSLTKTWDNLGLSLVSRG